MTTKPLQYKLTYLEATGDKDSQGQDRHKERMALTQVPYNRIERNKQRGHPSTTLELVITQKDQFTPYNGPKWATAKPSAACIKSVDEAIKIIESGGTIIPREAIYYYGKHGKNKAEFAKDKVFLCDIGDHSFYAPIGYKYKEVASMAEQKTAAGLVAWCKDHLGEPYWYGTYGKIADASMLASKTKQYPSHYASSRMPTYRKQLGKRVQDCVGLIKGYVWENKGKINYVLDQDKSADRMLEACKVKGPISALPEVPGTLVFLSRHVGVYIGDGWVIEARGFAYGVVKTRLKDRPWKNWGYCPYITYPQTASAPATKPTTTPTAQKPTLRKGNTGSAVKDLQEALNKAVSMGLVVDGQFGERTDGAVRVFQAKHKLEVDGICGAKTWAALGV